MGPTFTDGAIIQHLAKLRNLMAAVGIPVPPPVKRGTVTKSPSKIYGSGANPRVKPEPIEPLYPDGASFSKIKQEENVDVDPEAPVSLYDRAARANGKLKDVAGDDKEKVEGAQVNTVEKNPTKSATQPRTRAKGKSRGRRGNMSDEDDDEEVPELYDSEPGYTPPRKRRRTAAKPRRKASPAKGPSISPLTPSPSTNLPPPVEEAQANSPPVKIEEEEDSGPATRTRGVKRDYSQMAALSSDEVEPEEEAQQEEVTGVTEEDADLDVEEDATKGINQNASSELQDASSELQDAASELQGTEADDNGSDTKAEDDNTDIEAEDDHAADSEAETDVLNSEDTAAIQEDDQVESDFPVPSQAVSTPYGQLSVDPDLAVSLTYP